MHRIVTANKLLTKRQLTSRMGSKKKGPWYDKKLTVIEMVNSIAGKLGWVWDASGKGPATIYNSKSPGTESVGFNYTGDMSSLVLDPDTGNVIVGFDDLSGDTDADLDLMVKKIKKHLKLTGQNNE